MVHNSWTNGPLEDIKISTGSFGHVLPFDDNKFAGCHKILLHANGQKKSGSNFTPPEDYMILTELFWQVESSCDQKLLACVFSTKKYLWVNALKTTLETVVSVFESRKKFCSCDFPLFLVGGVIFLYFQLVAPFLPTALSGWLQWTGATNQPPQPPCWANNQVETAPDFLLFSSGIW